MEGEPTETEEELLWQIVDALTLEVIFDQHKKLKQGQMCVHCDSVGSDHVTRPGFDVFGQATGGSTSGSDTRFSCRNCSRTVVVSRYAPHLEKCMGVARTARNSSRIATLRLSAYLSSGDSLGINGHHQQHQHVKIDDDDDGEYDDDGVDDEDEGFAGRDGAELDEDDEEGDTTYMDFQDVVEGEEEEEGAGGEEEEEDDDDEEIMREFDVVEVQLGRKKQ